MKDLIMTASANTSGVIAPHQAAYGTEKIPVTVYPSSGQASKAVAAEIAELIRAKARAARRPSSGWRPARRRPRFTTN
jgi:hypothetical protein